MGWFAQAAAAQCISNGAKHDRNNAHDKNEHEHGNDDRGRDQDDERNCARRGLIEAGSASEPQLQLSLPFAQQIANCQKRMQAKESIQKFSTIEY